jgi:hypothetical protein
MCLHAKHVFSNQFGWYLSFNCIITEKCVYFDNDHLNPDWSNCEFILATRRPVVSLVLRVIFPELLTSGQLYYSDVMILFELYIIFELFLKLYNSTTLFFLDIYCTFVFVVCTCHETGNKQREKLFLLQIWQDRWLLPALIGRITPQTWKSITASFC